MESKTKFVIGLLIFIGVMVLIVSLVININYDGMEKFCEEKNMSFDINNAGPICYNINDAGKINFFKLGRINGEIYRT